MGINARIFQKDIFQDSAVPTITGGDSEVVDLDGASKFSCQAIYDVQAPSAKTFDSGKSAVLTNQSVTYTANDRGVAGNSITVTLVNPGSNNHALVITVVGTAITATLATGVAGAITTTATLLVAAINSSAAHDLVTASGSGVLALTALSVTPLATGADPEVDTDLDTISIPSHGFTTGFKIRLTTTGTLPDPLLTGTDYFVIVIDADTIQLAASLIDALAETAIVMTDQGSDGAVNTVTGVALAGATVTFKKSNSPDGPWVTIQAATTIVADGSAMLVQPDVAYRYFKAVKALTSGQVALQALTLVIGDAE